MKLEIMCNAYFINPKYQFEKRRFKVEPQCLNGKDGYVNAVKIKAKTISVTDQDTIDVWVDDVTKQPDVSILVDDVLSIKTIDDAKQ